VAAAEGAQLAPHRVEFGQIHIFCYRAVASICLECTVERDLAIEDALGLGDMRRIERAVTLLPHPPSVTPTAVPTSAIIEVPIKLIGAPAAGG